jgi:hypothetical protein
LRVPVQGLWAATVQHFVAPCGKSVGRPQPHMTVVISNLHTQSVSCLPLMYRSRKNGSAHLTCRQAVGHPWVPCSTAGPSTCWPSFAVPRRQGRPPLILVIILTGKAPKLRQPAWGFSSGEPLHTPSAGLRQTAVRQQAADMQRHGGTLSLGTAANRSVCNSCDSCLVFVALLQDSSLCPGPRTESPPACH